VQGSCGPLAVRMTTLGLGALLARLLSVQAVQNVAQRQVQRPRHVPQLDHIAQVLLRGAGFGRSVEPRARVRQGRDGVR
ncbi:MAG: hypothetical protein LC799_14395, partial [Actinobacteria bacterium]|nr:hypothetical protein [Actinomycetota bacterium]